MTPQISDVYLFPKINFKPTFCETMKLKIINHYARIGAVLTLSLCALACYAYGTDVPDNVDSLEIKGPEKVTCGNLAVFELDGATDWHMIPPDETATKWLVDTSGKFLYFASPAEGKFTVCGAVYRDGVAKIICMTFINGRDGDDEKIVIPEPDKAKHWISARIDSFPNTPENARICGVVTQAFHAASNGIERGVLKTPAAVRAVLRQNFSSNIALVSQDTRNHWTMLLDEIGLEIETKCKYTPTDISLLKKTIDEIFMELSKNY